MGKVFHQKDIAAVSGGYVGRFDGSNAVHASPAMAALAAKGKTAATDDESLPTSTKWSVMSSRVEGLVAELSQVVGKQDAYCVAQSQRAEGPAMKAVREKMLATPWAEEYEKKRTMFSYGEEMSTDPLEAILLKELVFMAAPRRVLEIGMFVGYGSVAMLEGSPSVEVVSLDIDPYLKTWLADCLRDAKQEGLAARHEVMVGPALESLPKLQGDFDMVFIDANKAEYKRYIEVILERGLLAPGGVIVCDNVLYNGYPYVSSHFDAQPARRGFGDAIREFNQWVADHPLLEQVVLPIRDGVSFVRRKADVPKTSSVVSPVLTGGDIESEEEVLLRPANSKAAVRVKKFGAHVLSWQDAKGRERFFLSSTTKLDGSTAIRGGIPLCWPQFGEFGPLNKHGYLRSGLGGKSWRIAKAQLGGEAPFVELRWRPDEETKKAWGDKPCEVVYTVTLRNAGDELDLDFKVVNLSEAEALPFTMCLHTYFKTEDCMKAEVVGLDGLPFEYPIGRKFPCNPNPGEAQSVKVQAGLAGEDWVQRLYGQATNRPSCELRLGEQEEGKVLLWKEGFEDWVLWNIGPENAKTMKDLGVGGNEWRNYICVEPGQASTVATVAPGQTWQGRHTLRSL